MRRKVIYSTLIISLILLGIGGYWLWQNHREKQAYEQAKVQDYIPAESCQMVTEITNLAQADSLLQSASLPQLSAILQLGLRIRQAAECHTSSATLVVSKTGETSVWFKTTQQEEEAILKRLPLLLNTSYPPVTESQRNITLLHYALPNGQFFHTLSAPGVIAFSLDGKLFREAQNM